MHPTSNYLTCAGREIHYLEWGSGNTETVIAWHGFARTGRDMDDLAADLVTKRYRVICPDTIGRGLSQWSAAPEREYRLAFYVQLAVELVDQLDVERFHWVGTSMGGAIGMLAAAGPLRRRIRCLVLNDIGPQIAQAAIERIRGYAGAPPAFATVSELEQYFRTIYKPYGWLSDAQWRRLTESSTRRLPDGRVTPHYDPNIVMQITHHARRLSAAVGGLGHARSAGAMSARRKLRPAVARDHRGDAGARPEGAGDRSRRLRPCTGAQHAGTLRAGRAVFRRGRLTRRSRRHRCGGIRVVDGAAHLPDAERSPLKADR
jgi:pimeloyl-ACP methyl ester carboxylesterase